MLKGGQGIQIGRRARPVPAYKLGVGQIVFSLLQLERCGVHRLCGANRQSQAGPALSLMRKNRESVVACFAAANDVREGSAAAKIDGPNRALVSRWGSRRNRNDASFEAKNYFSDLVFPESNGNGPGFIRRQLEGSDIGLGEGDADCQPRLDERNSSQRQPGAPSTLHSGLSAHNAARRVGSGAFVDRGNVVRSRWL